MVINQPIERVFEFLTRYENIPHFVPGVLKVEQTSPGPIGVGTTYQLVSKIFVPGLKTVSTYEVTEYEHNKKISVKSITGLAQGSAAETLESVEGGTRVTVSGEGRLCGFFRLLESLAAINIKSNLQASRSNVKAFLERQAQRPVTLGSVDNSRPAQYQ